MSAVVDGVEVHRGQAILRELIDTAPDLTSMDREAFATWIGKVLEDASRDEVFRKRSAVRDLRSSNRRKLRYRQKRIAQARAAYSSCGCGPELSKLERDISSALKGVEGLRKAVEESRADPTKLASFERRLESLTMARDAKLSDCPERGQLDRAKDSLERFEEDVGLVAIQEQIQALNLARGRSGSSRGKRFEEISVEILEQVAIPELTTEGPPPICLTGATLGCARGEFDHLLVVQRDPSAPVDVLALVEAKRNINDLAHGFRLRQENLAWLTGSDQGFDPAQYRNQHFPSGHFDRPVEHAQGDRVYRFDRSSFDRFRRDETTGDFLERLWFVTERRRLLGMTMAQRERLVNKLATDLSVDPERPNSLARLQPWVLGLLEGLTTREVLQRYASAGLADQILVRERA
ncbi:MAG: hypothetical protein KTR31_35845 [Myxococcales bacterium]|nr:hypothetical protein [Myxococcales bacterium]